MRKTATISQPLKSQLLALFAIYALFGVAKESNSVVYEINEQQWLLIGGEAIPLCGDCTVSEDYCSTIDQTYECKKSDGGDSTWCDASENEFADCEQDDEDLNLCYWDLSECSGENCTGTCRESAVYVPASCL